MLTRQLRASIARGGRKPPCASASEADGGYAAVDALVAITILSMTLILAIGAGASAKRVAAQAGEMRHASDLMRYLMESERGADGAGGSLSGFDWRLRLAASGDTAPNVNLQVCERRIEVVSRASGRRYALASAAICPAKAGA